MILLAGTRNLYNSIQVVIRSIKDNTNEQIAVFAEDEHIDNADITINVKGKLFTSEYSPNRNTMWTQMAYARLFAPQYLDCDKVLYMDCDCVLVKPINELLNLDMGDALMAGVQEPDKSRHTPYYNAGVLLLNLKQWRAENITEKVMDIINREPLSWADQDALNMICGERAIPLDCKYNSNPFCGMSEDPSIWHYAYWKAWNPSAPHPEYWQKYA